MRTFNYSVLKDKKRDNEIIAYIAQIHEYKAKQGLILKHEKEKFDNLIEIAKVQSTQSSNEIEGIRTTNTRLKQLVKEMTEPKNRDEEEIAGYRDVLNLINENYEYITLTPNNFLQLHKVLYGHSSKSIGGFFKNVQNYISGVDEKGNSCVIFTPPSPFETPYAMETLCNEFNKAILDNEVDPLILIPIFIHDFLCIHPFLDGNGRLSRLLTTLLLYKSGYFIGKYISLEAKIAKNKSLYYDALEASQIGWDKEEDTPEAFIKYMLGTIISAYRDFDERAKMALSKTKSVDLVKEAISTIITKFDKNKIIELCPSLSVKAIELALKKLVEQGNIKKCGAGRSTFYIKNSD